MTRHIETKKASAAVLAQMRKASRRISKLQATLRNRSSHASQVAWLAERREYLTAIQSENWRKLDALGRRYRGDHERNISVLHRIATDAKTVWTEVNAFRALVRLLPPLGKVAGWKAVREKTGELLREKGLPSDRIEQLLSNAERSGGSKFSSDARRDASALVDDIDEAHQMEARSWIGGVLAECVANFNRSRPSPHLHTRRDIRAWTTRTNHALARIYRQIHSALAKGDVLALSGAAEQLGACAKDGLAIGSKLAAWLAITGTKVDSLPRGHVQLALDTAEVIRFALEASALSERLTFLCRLPHQYGPLARWMSAARKLTWSHSSDAVALHEASSPPSKRTEGAIITMQGRIQSLQISHRARKAISSATLRDGRGDDVIVAIPYIKLDSGGLVPGSVARITGRYSRRVEWLENSSALIVKRKSYQRSGQFSWREWVKVELRPIFEAVPHGLEVSWSWEKGRNGAGNQLRYGVWFHESGGKYGL